VAGIDDDGNVVANAGTVEILANGDIEVVPVNGFQGTIIAEYTATDDDADSDSALIIVDVIDASGNELFAGDDSKVSDMEAEINGNLLNNDFDPEGDAFAVTDIVIDTDGDGLGDTSKAADIDGTTSISVGGVDINGNAVPNAGTLIIDSDGTYEFTPNSNFAGNINICYMVCDAQAPAACDNATLEITVLEVFRDYGDSPADYPECWHRAMSDANSDDVFDGANDVWLGFKSSFEGASQSSQTGDSDLHDDALVFGNNPGNFPTTIAPNTSYNVNLTVNSTTPNLVYYGLWIDWNNDGTYDNFYNGSQVTASPATASVTITSPAAYAGEPLNVRLRVDDSTLDSDDFQGGKTNGEVEDYAQLTVLPVKLISFDATLVGCNVDLNWVTESEINFSHFEVERSTDGREFRTIERIEAFGPGTRKVYNFLDKNTMSSNYYRLKMIDLDGTYSYSKVTFEDTDCADNEFKVYPNPLGKYDGVLNVVFYAKEPVVEIHVIDMLGEVVKKATLEVEPENRNTVQLDVYGIPSGTYNIRVVGDKMLSKIISILE